MSERDGQIRAGLIITESEKVQKSEEVTRENTKRFVEMKITSAFDGLENIVAYFLSEEKKLPNKFEAIALHHQMKLFLDKLHITGVDFEGGIDHMGKFFRDFFIQNDELKEFKTQKIIYIPITGDTGVQNEAGFELVVNKKIQFQIKPIKGSDGKVDPLAQDIEDKDFDDSY